MPAVFEVKIVPAKLKSVNPGYFVFMVKNDRARLIGRVYKRRMPKTSQHSYLWGWMSDTGDIFGFTQRKYSIKDLVQAQYPLMPAREALANMTNLFYGIESRPDMPEA